MTDARALPDQRRIDGDHVLVRLTADELEQLIIAIAPSVLRERLLVGMELISPIRAAELWLLLAGDIQEQNDQPE